MADLEASTPALADPTVELDVDGQRYRMQLPDAATDYIQKKVATERRPYEFEMLDEMRRHLRPGDLVFWGSSASPSSIYHVALYVGNGMIIQAPHTGAYVDEVSMYSWIAPNFAARP